jgi:hypothetical protein
MVSIDLIFSIINDIFLLNKGLVVCEGIATTKKLAKHNAAEKALTELKSRPELVSKETKDNVINDFVKLKISASDIWYLIIFMSN